MNAEQLRQQLVNAQYYLHTNGQLIFKPNGGVERESSFVVKVWQVLDHVRTPQDYTQFLREAREAGASADRINEIALVNDLDENNPGWQYQVYGGE